MLITSEYMHFEEDIDVVYNEKLLPDPELLITGTQTTELRGTHLVRGLGRRAVLVDVRRSYKSRSLITTRELVTKAAKVAHRHGWKIAYVLNHPVYEDEWLVTNADNYSKWLYDEPFRFISI